MFLRHATQVTVLIGPAVLETDGVTPVTGITLASVNEAALVKHQGLTAISITSRTWQAVTGLRGWYALTLTTGDTDTEGHLSVEIHDDDAFLPMFARFLVIDANAYDSIVEGTDLLQVDMTELAGAVAPVTNLADSALGIVRGQAVTGTLTNTQMTTNLVEATDDHYIDRTIVWIGGNLAGAAARVTDYDGSSKLLTFTPVVEAPANTDPFVIV